MTTLKGVTPITITDAMLTSSTLVENDHPVWSAATPYVVGDKVIRTGTHRKYECKQAHTDATPEDNLTGTTPKWQDLGPTNRWAAFDEQITSRATAATEFTFVFQPGRINTLGLIDIDASSVSVVMRSSPGGPIVYSADINLTVPCEPNWDDYFFSEVERRTDYVITNLPRFGTCELTVTVRGTDPALGVLILGRWAALGLTLYPASTGIINLSRITTDEFGNRTFVRRGFSKRMDLKTALIDQNFDFVQRTLAKFGPGLVLWIGADNLYTSLIVYGFYRDFSQGLDYNDNGTCTLSIEGLNQ